MPRIGRIVIPNYPHHVVQRGHNRQVVFAGEEDYQRYLRDLCELREVFGVRVYAYCLMTNHVHLLLVPGEDVTGIGRVMKALAARATRYRNRLERRAQCYEAVFADRYGFLAIGSIRSSNSPRGSGARIARAGVAR